MLGLIRAVDGLASKVLLQNDVTEEQMLRLIQQLINDGNMMSGEVADYTPRARGYWNAAAGRQHGSIRHR